MKTNHYFLIFILIFFTACNSERSACDCQKTIEDLSEKNKNGELPYDMSEDEINEKYLKGCEWVKEVDESILKEELDKCS